MIARLTRLHQVSWWMVIHFVLALLLPLGVFNLTSCLEAKQDPISFGTDVSPQSIADTLNASVGNKSPEDIGVGEFVHIETSQQIMNNPRFVTRDAGITITQRAEDEDTIQLTLVYDLIEYDGDGNSERSVFEDEVYVAKSASIAQATAKLTAANLSKLSLKSPGLAALSSSAIGACDLVEHESITYHDLRVASKDQPVPQAVTTSNFCQDRSPCHISATTVEYDQVIWQGEDGEKIHCKYVFSNEVPYLAGQLEQCISLLVKVEEHSILLTECSKIRNFFFGQQP